MWDRAGWTLTKLPGNEIRFEARDYGKFTTPVVAVSKNNWHRILVRRSSGNLTIFFDDKPARSWANETGTIKSNSKDPLLIGKRIDDNFGMRGIINEIVIWQRALSNEEVKKLWNRGTGGVDIMASKP